MRCRSASAHCGRTASRRSSSTTPRRTDRRDRRRAGRGGDPQRPQRGLWPRQQYRRAGGGQRVPARSSIPDCVVEPGAVAALVDAARRYPDAALFAPQIVEPSGRVFFQPRSLLAPSLTNPARQARAARGRGLRAVLLGRLLPHPPRRFSCARRLRREHLPVLRGRRSLPPHRGCGAGADLCAAGCGAPRARRSSAPKPGRIFPPAGTRPGRGPM